MSKVNERDKEEREREYEKDRGERESLWVIKGVSERKRVNERNRTKLRERDRKILFYIAMKSI